MLSAVQRRRLTALGVLAAIPLGAVLVAGRGDDAAEPEASATAAGAPGARPPAQLPGGGRRLFPDRRVVAFYGSPVDRQLGALGIGTPAQAARRLRRQARPYTRKTRPVLPAMELITTLATADAGADGLHRTHLPDRQIRRYLRAARRAKSLLILDVQPGRATFGAEVERLERWLREPDVGLALDPEWHVRPGEVPGRVIGQVDADVVNATGRYLARIVAEHDLPEKLLIVHRFTDDMIARDERLRPHRGVATVVNVDGFGGGQVKIAKYRDFVRRTPALHQGFKLFYEEDAGLLRPRDVLKMGPPPDVVVYE